MRGRVVYLPRDYPSLSQTFVRNEVVALRELGQDVDVTALRFSYADNIEPGWGGEFTLARRLPWSRSIVDSTAWLLRHPLRFRRMWKLMRMGPAYMRWTAVRYLPTMARRLRREQVKAVHTHFAFEHAWSSLYLATLLDVPATVTVHAADIYHDTRAAVELLERFDGVVNVCTYNEELLRNHGLRRPAMTVVPCGVDLPEAPPDTERRNRLVSVGRLVPKKGYRGLLEAMPGLLSELPDTQLEIIGGGDLEAELLELVDELGLEGSVHLHGPQSHAVSVAAIDGATVFVLNCAVPPDGDTDALPVVLREAMARAKPIVTTAVAGIPETLDESCGWVVPPDSPQELGRALVEALSDPAAARRKGAAARDRVAAHYTLQDTARGMATFFATIRRADGNALHPGRTR